jgi:uncharacterized membrane protein YccC
MTSWTFVNRLVKTTTAFDRGLLEWRYGIRCAVGVAVPLIAALEIGYPLSGVSVAIGALIVGFASRQGYYRTRAATMLMTAVMLGLSAFVGSMTGQIPWLDVLISVAWALGFGLVSSLGPSANVVGLNAIIVLIVFGQFGYSPLEALEQGGLVIAGGVFQTLLLVAVWPFGRFSAERKLLARAYAALAGYAAHLPSVALASPDPSSLSNVEKMLTDPPPFARRGEIAAFENLLADAERIRGQLAAMATDRYVLEHANITDGVAAIGTLGHRAHDILRAIADALNASAAPGDLEAAFHDLDLAVEAVERVRGEHAHALADARALAGGLRAAVKSARFPVEGVGSMIAPTVKTVVIDRDALADAWATLRANATIRSENGRHALRLGLTVGVAVILEHTLPVARGYWIAMTAAIVLRPDFGATFTRGAQRLGGTFLGALVAGGIAFTFHPGAVVHLGLVIFFAWFGYTVFAASYAAFSLAITAYVIFLLAYGGLPEHLATVDRLVATAIGGVLAMIAYVVFPSWGRTLVPDRVADSFAAQRRYTQLVFAAYQDPAKRDDRALHDAQLASWLARSNAEAAVDRLLGEPVRPRALTVRAALGTLAAGRRFGLAALGLHARIPAIPLEPAAPFADLAAAIDTAFAQIVEALHTRTYAFAFPDLRGKQVRLRDALIAAPSDVASAVIAETDLMVDALNTVAFVLGRVETDVDPSIARET